MKTWPQLEADHKRYYRETSNVPSGEYHETQIGWRTIVVDALNAVEVVVPEFDIHQIKEKFGGLRMYLSCDEHVAVREIVRRAEAAAYETCETCGAPAIMDENQHWIKTLCPWHIGERAKATAERKLEYRLAKIATPE